MGLGAKSYMKKRVPIHEEMSKLFTIYEEAVSHIGMTLHMIPLNFLIYEEIFFLSVYLCPSLFPLSLISGYTHHVL